MTDFDAIRSALGRANLIYRGGFDLAGEAIDKDQDPVSEGTKTLILCGLKPNLDWSAFSIELDMKQRNPLDDWSKRVIKSLAESLGGTAIFPFGGPPHYPFQQWAKRAENLRPSPLGILMHPVYGLWHAYRAAIAFPEMIELPDATDHDHPCDSCAEKPCLSACPVEAFSPDGYDVPSCRDHLASQAGSHCMAGGCQARAACPVGPEYQYQPGHLQFHMAAFRRALG